jgi:hypothetical protein
VSIEKMVQCLEVCSYYEQIIDKSLSWTIILTDKMDSQQASPMNQIEPTAICHSSEDGRFITWTQARRELFSIIPDVL